jgi:hypothetical protein
VGRVADRLLVDLGGDRQVTVTAWRDGGMPETIARSRLEWLALVAEQDHRQTYALACAIRSVSLFPHIPDAATGTAPQHLAWLAAQLGIAAVEDTWPEITGSPLPPAVRDYITSNPAAELPGDIGDDVSVAG